MKNDLTKAEKYRVNVKGLPSTKHGDNYGTFKIPQKNNKPSLAIMANGANEFSDGWEHVSVSLPNRCPTWEEMCMIKDLFFEPEELVVQYHPPASDHINNHNYCLHLWRNAEKEIPMPPKEFV